MREKNCQSKLALTPSPQQQEILPTRILFDKNFGLDKLYPCGPTCLIKGIQIPHMVRWSPKGSITSSILVEALAHIDSFNVMDRRNEIYLFLLLDGHNFCFEPPFLEYSTNKEHLWQVFIGVPYGTSLW